MNSLDDPLERAFQLANTMLRHIRKRAYIVVMKVDSEDRVHQVSGWAGGRVPHRSRIPQKALTNAAELVTLPPGGLVFGPERESANRTTRGAVRQGELIVSVAGLGETSQMLALVLLRAAMEPTLALHSIAYSHAREVPFFEKIAADEVTFGTQVVYADIQGRHAFVPVNEPIGKISYYVAHHLDETLTVPSIHWELVVPNSRQFAEWLNRLPNHEQTEYSSDGSTLSIITWQKDDDGIPIGVSLRNKWWDPSRRPH